MTQEAQAGARNAHWQHHINHWQTSDLSGADYCRQHKLTYHCFIYWRHKFASTITEPPVEVNSGVQALSAFLYAFTNRQRNKIKCLYWEDNEGINKRDKFSCGGQH